MRDHPHHDVTVLGGMWGAKLTPYIRSRMRQSFGTIFKSKIFFANRYIREPDQELLRDYIW